MGIVTDKKLERVKDKIKISESQLKRQILDFLRWKGILCWNNRTVGVWNAKTERYIPAPLKGCSDIFGIIKNKDGKFLAIECKVGNNLLTPYQEEFLRQINENNGIGIVCYSLEDVERELKEYLK